VRDGLGLPCAACAMPPVKPWLTWVFGVLHECTRANLLVTAHRLAACLWLKKQ
jgi:hypothetical protein